MRGYGIKRICCWLSSTRPPSFYVKNLIVGKLDENIFKICGWPNMNNDCENGILKPPYKLEDKWDNSK